jgi:hypothetical protein
MSSVNAVTEELKFSVRIASFYEMNSDVSSEIVKEVTELMAKLGKRHDFLVWRVSMEREKEKNT